MKLLLSVPAYLLLFRPDAVRGAAFQRICGQNGCQLVPTGNIGYAPRVCERGECPRKILAKRADSDDSLFGERRRAMLRELGAKGHGRGHKAHDHVRPTKHSVDVAKPMKAVALDAEHMGSWLNTVVESLVKSPQLTQKSWIDFGGDSIVQALIEGHLDPVDLNAALKTAVVLVSAIVRTMDPAKTRAFFAHNGIRGALESHIPAIRALMESEFDPTLLSMHPGVFEMSTVGKERLAYMEAPYWLINDVLPSVATSSKLRQMVLLHKLVRYQVKYGSAKAPVAVSRSHPLATSVEAIMGLSRKAVRNAQLRSDGKDWVTSFMTAALQSKLFRQELVCHATFQVNIYESYKAKSHASYEAVGRVLGLMVINGRKMNNAYFPMSFYAHLLGHKMTLDLLKIDMPWVHKQSVKILGTKLDDPKNADYAKSLRFVGTIDGVEVMLDDKHHSVAVTEANKHYYVDQLVEYHLSTSVKTAMARIKKGFLDVVPVRLDGLKASDLRRMLTKHVDIDVDDFIANVKYEGFQPDSKQPEWFKKGLKRLCQAKLQRLLEVMTGSYKVPTGGFKNMREGYRLVSLGKGHTKMQAMPVKHQLGIPNFKSEAELTAALTELLK